jgi:hypothetical protein
MLFDLLPHYQGFTPFYSNGYNGVQFPTWHMIGT